jgi:hypothetical protein
MKTSIKIAVAALVIASFGFSGCKKGDGDPFLSLKTRKSRVAGEWTLTKGEGTRVTTSGSMTTNEAIAYADGVETTTTTTTPATATTTSTNKYTTEYDFEKDGTFTLTDTDNNNSTPDVTTTKGTWNFTGGVGDAKNKSQIVLTITSITSGTTTISYTGSSCPQSIFDLYELKSKEMIMIDKGTSSTGNTVTTEIKWTLTAK